MPAVRKNLRLDPFISTSGNPENGEWDEFARYLKAIEDSSIEELEHLYADACLAIGEEARVSLEANPRLSEADSPYIAHAKRLFLRHAWLRYGVIYEKDELYVRV